MFWHEFAERFVRQLSQVALPILLGASTAGGWRIDWGAFGIIVGATMALTAVKVTVALLNEWQATVWWQDLLDRAGSAGLTTLIGFVPADVVDPAAVDWATAAWVSALAAVIAVAQYFADPPTYGRGRHVAR